MQQNLRFKIVGLLLFTAACLALLLYLFTLAGGRLRLHTPYQAHVLVPDALNIVNNSDVRRDGIKVGRVRDVTSQDGASDIKFEIEKPKLITIYKNAVVRVRTKTLVGESYLDISPGTPNSGKLPDGGTLSLDNAAEVTPLERILNSLDPKTRQEVRNNLKGVGVGLNGKGEELNQLFGALKPTVADGGTLMRILRPQREQLAGLIQNTGRVMGAFGDRTEALRSLATDAKKTAVAVENRDAQLRQTIDEIPDTLTQAQQTVNKLAGFSGRATPVVSDLRVSATNLSPAIRDLEPAARDTRTLFRELNPFLDSIDPLLTQLKPGSDKLRTVVAPLDALMRQINPTAQALEPYKRDLGTFFSNTGSLANGTDAYGHKGRVFAVGGLTTSTNLSPSARKLLGLLIDNGVAQKINNIHLNFQPAPDGGTNLKDYNPKDYHLPQADTK